MQCGIYFSQSLEQGKVLTDRVLQSDLQAGDEDEFHFNLCYCSFFPAKFTFKILYFFKCSIFIHVTIRTVLLICFECLALSKTK